MRALVLGLLTVFALAIARDGGAQQRASAARDIYITGVEFKGATTTDKVAAPPVNPTMMSRGYAYKGPGSADPSDPKKWEVASYQFSPAFVTVQQGDMISLSVFIANGDHHEVQLTDPDGEKIIPKTTWDRGREYTSFFEAKKSGAYQLSCGTHAPSMTATILVLPR